MKLKELKTEAIDFYMADAADLPGHTNVEAFLDAVHSTKQIQPFYCMPTSWNWLELFLQFLLVMWSVNGTFCGVADGR